ncbi:hypothetical protein CBL_07985 [Carabus blaptoides fortunei]
MVPSGVEQNMYALQLTKRERDSRYFGTLHGTLYDWTAKCSYNFVIPAYKPEPEEQIKPVVMAAIVVSRETFDVLLKPISSRIRWSYERYHQTEWSLDVIVGLRTGSPLV